MMNDIYEQIRWEAEIVAEAREAGENYQQHLRELARQFAPEHLRHAAKQFMANVEEANASELLAKVCQDAAKKASRMGRRHKWSSRF